MSGGPDFTRSRLGLVMFVTMSGKARLDKVGDRLVKARARSLTILDLTLLHILDLLHLLALESNLLLRSQLSWKWTMLLKLLLHL